MFLNSRSSSIKYAVLFKFNFENKFRALIGKTVNTVKKEIEAALARRSHVEAGRIEVRVDGSAVTLSGTVDSWAERDSARESAWGAPGVMSVDDKMTVGF
jgi:osmotically-inducible protein OsmY